MRKPVLQRLKKPPCWIWRKRLASDNRIGMDTVVADVEVVCPLLVDRKPMNSPESLFFGDRPHTSPSWAEPSGGADYRNSHAYQNYQRQRQMTLGDLLLENRIVFLQGEIYTGNANELVMKLLYLQSENRKKDIHFYINSPGGDVIATLAIYDTMQILSCPVATYCVGHAMSGAAILLAGGTKGKRSALPNSRIMVHQPHGGVGGQVSDIEIQAKEILRYRDVLNQILAKHTGKPIDEIVRDMDRDFFMSADEAKDYGLVDRVTEKTQAESDNDGVEV